MRLFELNSQEAYDVVVIGAGVSGLMAGYVLKKKNVKFLIIERGNSFEERMDHDPVHASNGLGGSGFFSDGKLSYYPASRAVWELLDKKKLMYAYDELYELFKRNGIKIKERDSSWFPEDEPLSGKTYKYADTYNKTYDSQYIEKEQRAKLIQNIYKYIGIDNVKLKSNVTHIDYNGDCYSIGIDNNRLKLLAKKVIIANGRYGAISLFKNLKAEMNFIRYEVGVRIESPSSEFPFYNEKQIDYKQVYKISDSLRVRTFCYCRDGIVVQSVDGKIYSHNGSSDIKTEMSNMGVNLALFSAENSKLKSEIEKVIHGEIQPFKINLVDFLNSNMDYIGEHFDEIMKIYIDKMFLGYNKSQSVVYGPTVEGVGYYPRLQNEGLCLYNNDNVWIAGDCSGIFRGLLAAAISGIYIGHEVVEG